MNCYCLWHFGRAGDAVVRSWTTFLRLRKTFPVKEMEMSWPISVPIFACYVIKCSRAGRGQHIMNGPRWMTGSFVGSVVLVTTNKNTLTMRFSVTGSFHSLNQSHSNPSIGFILGLHIPGRPSGFHFGIRTQPATLRKPKSKCASTQLGQCSFNQNRICRNEGRFIQDRDASRKFR